MAEDAAARGANGASANYLPPTPGLAEDPVVLEAQQMLLGDSPEVPIG
jgi:hypothetical protein